ncbi:hypothetical protein CDAR_591511 [Caerostris darwini]|uniref:Uncharacterized protein n=1 Tax=Caerostris darwini TaxID=1538125 RepID=A0AAV4PH31_9ARAC|nr:hypothetical protein CDAR_591511 [Caerostris darwini]
MTFSVKPDRLTFPKRKKSLAIKGLKAARDGEKCTNCTFSGHVSPPHLERGAFNLFHQSGHVSWINVRPSRRQILLRSRHVNYVGPHKCSPEYREMCSLTNHSLCDMPPSHHPSMHAPPPNWLIRTCNICR